MKANLTTKQRKFWKCYLESHNLAKSAKYAGCKCSTIQSYSTQGHELLKSLEVSMPELLNARGLGTDQLTEVLANQLKATKPLIATWQGKITDERFYPDNAAIGKATEHLGRMHGVFIDKYELTGRDGGDIFLSFKSSKSKNKRAVSLD